MRGTCGKDMHMLWPENQIMATIYHPHFNG